MKHKHIRIAAKKKLQTWSFMESVMYYYDGLRGNEESLLQRGKTLQFLVIF